MIAEKLKLELTQRQMAEMDQLSRTHRGQMAAAKMELERSIEIKQQQVSLKFTTSNQFNVRPKKKNMLACPIPIFVWVFPFFYTSEL